MRGAARGQETGGNRDRREAQRSRKHDRRIIGFQIIEQCGSFFSGGKGYGIAGVKGKPGTTSALRQRAVPRPDHKERRRGSRTTALSRSRIAAAGL